MNATKVQTYLGLVKAVLVAVIDFVMHLTPEGLNWKSPVFFAGLGYAAVEGVKGYYAQGIAPAGQVAATVPVGTVPVTKPDPSPPAA